MTTPAPVAPISPAPAPKKSIVSRALEAVAWARSGDGRKDIGAFVAVVTAIYTALHRAGVF
jgi:hypothetical protein